MPSATEAMARGRVLRCRGSPDALSHDLRSRPTVELAAAFVHRAFHHAAQSAVPPSTSKSPANIPEITALPRTMTLPPHMSVISGLPVLFDGDVLACSTIETASQIILGIKWQDRLRDFLYPTKEQLKLGKASSRWLMRLVFVTRLRYAVGNNVSGFSLGLSASFWNETHQPPRIGTLRRARRHNFSSQSCKPTALQDPVPAPLAGRQPVCTADQEIPGEMPAYAPRARDLR